MPDAAYEQQAAQNKKHAGMNEFVKAQQVEPAGGGDEFAGGSAQHKNNQSPEQRKKVRAGRDQFFHSALSEIKKPFLTKGFYIKSQFNIKRLPASYNLQRQAMNRFQKGL